MKIVNQNMYDEYVEHNSDQYGRVVIRYAVNWADSMESEMNSGKKLEDIAEKTSHDADTEGITGFMYGCAVSMLTRCWEHGEQLRKWHNMYTQLDTEGEEANKKGGILNPALLSLGGKK